MSENKKLDGRPAYALEKEIVCDEIDECITVCGHAIDFGSQHIVKHQRRGYSWCPFVGFNLLN